MVGKVQEFKSKGTGRSPSAELLLGGLQCLPTPVSGLPFIPASRRQTPALTAAPSSWGRGHTAGLQRTGSLKWRVLGTKVQGQPERVEPGWALSSPTQPGQSCWPCGSVPSLLPTHLLLQTFLPLVLGPPAGSLVPEFPGMCPGFPHQGRGHSGPVAGEGLLPTAHLGKCLSRTGLCFSPGVPGPSVLTCGLHRGPCWHFALPPRV